MKLFTFEIRYVIKKHNAFKMNIYINVAAVKAMLSLKILLDISSMYGEVKIMKRYTQQYVCERNHRNTAI